MSNDNQQVVTIEPLLVRAEQAAKLLGISRSKFYSMHSAGLVPMPIRLIDAPRWDVNELKNWIQNRCPSREVWERTMKGRR